jgi:hypothetical protein
MYCRNTLVNGHRASIVRTHIRDKDWSRMFRHEEYRVDNAHFGELYHLGQVKTILEDSVA